MPFYTGLLYYFVRPIARIGIWTFFRKIYLLNTHHIPKGKAVILASNHPTGFMEPCIMAVFFRRPLYYLVRGDFFRKPIFNFLLRALNMIPIFRKRDGSFRDLKSNFASFDACYKALDAKRTIMIYPEGNAVMEKRLRPIKKGVSRLAYGTFEAYPDLEELYIVPIGVNYTYADRPRSMVVINCQEPILVRNLLAESENNFARFDQILRSKLTTAMQAGLVHIEAEEDEALVEQLHQFERLRSPVNQQVFPVLSFKNLAFWKQEKSVSDLVNCLSGQEKENLGLQLTGFFQNLEQKRLSDGPLKGASTWSLIIKTSLLILTAIPCGLGFLFTWGISAIAWNIRRTKVKRNTFLGPVLVATNIGLYFLYYLFWLFLSLFTGYWYIFLSAILLGVFAYASNIWKESYNSLTNQRRYRRLSPEDKAKIQGNLQAIQAYLLALKK